jgi:DNA-binding NarL/FixJ family response regulator
MTPAGAVPEFRVLLMVPERSLLEGLLVGLREQGVLIAGAFHTPATLLEAVSAKAADVVLISALSDRVAGAGLARAVRSSNPEARIALLVEDDPAGIGGLRTAPVDVFLRASLPLRAVADGLRRLAAGETQHRLAWFATDPPSEDALGVLSARQREILELIGRGWSSQEIAERLDLSPNTVKYHVRQVYLRLHVRNRAQAVRLLLEANEEHLARR